MRVLIALLVILLVLGAGLVWFAVPMAAYTLEQQLARNDVSLTALEIDQIKPSNVSLASIELTSADLELKAQGLSVVLDENGEIAIDGAAISIKLLSGSASEPQPISEILEMLDQAVANIPKRGHIRQVDYCQPGACLTFDLHWRRLSSGLSASLFFPEFNTWLKIDKQDHWQFSLVGKRPEGVLLADITLIESEATLDINKRIWLAADDFQGLFDGRFEIRDLGLEGVSRIPLSATPDELVSLLISNNQMTFQVELEQQMPEATVITSGEVALGIHYSDQDVQFRIQALPPLEVFRPDLGSGVVRLSGAQSCGLSLGFGTIECALESVMSSWDIESEYGNFAGDLNFASLLIELDEQTPNVTGRLAISLFDLDQGQAVLEAEAPFEVISGANFSTDALVGELLGSEVSSALSYEIESSSGSAKLSWKSSDNLGAVTAYLSEKLQAGEVADEITKGLSGSFELNTEATFRFGPELKLEHQTEFSSESFDLEYDGYKVNSGQLYLSAWRYPKTEYALDVTLDALDVGVAVTDFSLVGTGAVNALTSSFDFTGERLRLGLLGGQVVSEAFEYDSTSGMGSAMLSLDKLKVQELLALQQQEIEGSGLLSGSVPVQFENANVTVTNAEVAAIAPGGFVRYEADPSVREFANSNVGVAVVLDAMKDFQYHTLQASVDYTPDGKMLARTSIKGANPNYQDGREVHLNLNLEENILVLLQSLRLGSDIAERISDKRGGK